MIESRLYNHLLHRILEVDGRIYPQVAGDDAQTPYLCYTVVFGRDTTGADGSVRSTKSSVQIDIYAATSVESKLVRNRVKEVMYAFPEISGGIEHRDGYEPDSKLYRQIVECNIKEKGMCDNGN